MLFSTSILSKPRLTLVPRTQRFAHRGTINPPKILPSTKSEELWGIEYGLGSMFLDLESVVLGLLALKYRTCAEKLDTVDGFTNFHFFFQVLAILQPYEPRTKICTNWHIIYCIKVLKIFGAIIYRMRLSVLLTLLSDSFLLKCSNIKIKHSLPMVHLIFILSKRSNLAFFHWSISLNTDKYLQHPGRD